MTKDVYIWIGHGTTEMVTLIQGFLVTSGGEFVAGSSRGYGVTHDLVVRFDHQIKIIPPPTSLLLGSPLPNKLPQDGVK